jgi:pentalenene oxygenase
MSARNRIKCVLTEVIEEERKALEVENSHLADTSSLDSGAKSSLIRRLLKESEKHSFITDDVIVDNILTFLFAGTDTTASILTSSFYELAKNPTLLNRLQSCVNSDVEGTEHKSDDVLLAFISEVQRVYPAAPFTMREIIREGINMGDGLGTIPPGYLVTYSIAGTLLDDEISYPRPRVFDLDRWLVRDKPHVCAFGGGNRICPGRFLANTESITLLRLGESLIRRGGDQTELGNSHAGEGTHLFNNLLLCLKRSVESRAWVRLETERGSRLGFSLYTWPLPC